MTHAELERLISIAQENIPCLENRKDLERHFSDDEDFYDISVWCLKNALIAAYELGKTNGRLEAQKGKSTQNVSRETF